MFGRLLSLRGAGAGAGAGAGTGHGVGCGAAAGGSGCAGGAIVGAGGATVWAGGALGWPKFGFCALQSATSCGLTVGRDLLARRRCGVPRMIGAMQSTRMPSPALAPPCTNPACRQAALIAAQAG